MPRGVRHIHGIRRQLTIYNIYEIRSVVFIPYIKNLKPWICLNRNNSQGCNKINKSFKENYEF